MRNKENKLMRYSKSKEINEIVKNLVKKHGCVFWYGGKHGRLLHPQSMCILTVPLSPSCSKAWRNFKRDTKLYFCLATEL